MSTAIKFLIIQIEQLKEKVFKISDGSDVQELIGSNDQLHASGNRISLFF
jgi:hypothetical protein